VCVKVGWGLSLQSWGKSAFRGFGVANYGNLQKSIRSRYVRI
jgi:hypothetical protein